MANFPASTIKVTGIELFGEDKVRITLDLLVDVHRLVEVSGQMLSVAAKGAAKKKK